MRLVDHHQAFIRPAIPESLQGHRHLGRVMPIIIDQQHLAIFHLKFSLHIEASTDAGKILDAAAYVLAGNAFIGGDNDGSCRI